MIVEYYEPVISISHHDEPFTASSAEQFTSVSLKSLPEICNVWIFLGCEIRMLTIKTEKQ